MVGVAVILGVIVAAAGIASASGKKKTLVEEDEDIDIVTPDGKEVSISEDDAAAIAEGGEPVLIPPDNSGGTTVDTDLEIVAAEEGEGLGDAVKEVVTEVTGGANPEPISIAETDSDNDPHGTIALAKLMLAREVIPGWKSDLKDDIAEWQRDVSLVSDGLFGIKSAARMAEEVGYLPLVRYWPKTVTTKKQGTTEFSKAIEHVIATMLRPELPDSEPHIDALHGSISREKAVTFGDSNPPPQDTTQWMRALTDKLQAKAEAKGKKAIA